MDADLRLTPLAEERLRTALGVASEFGAGVPLSDLVALLPGGSPGTMDDLARLFETRPDLGKISGGIAYAREQRVPASGVRERELRGERYLRAAKDLLDTTLVRTRPYATCVAVTGSVAYGEPEADDDCDFFVVTPPGCVWVYLALTFSLLRARPRAKRDRTAPAWCFNYIVEEGAVRSIYSTRRDFLFAREALMLRTLVGAEFYRVLLKAAPWMAEETPRLYAQWELARAEASVRSQRVSAGLRAINWLIYPVLASYLQLQSLVRNWRFRRTGRSDAVFRLVTRPDRMEVLSLKFEKLARRWQSSSVRPLAE